MAPLAVLAHQRGLRLHRYLDDWLLVALSPSDLLTLGSGQLRKSELQPSQRINYLGMLIDTTQNKVFPSQVRLTKFQQLLEHFLELTALSALIWLK